ncbi:hypothetical protein [Paenibacillus thalictri]|uniref:Uncharacterized protein n=1 Tax=Paenibacillus thalictri TaxID=2527873 RepID=A0A4Q9DGE2_9BACL|nr:hypothetical protein [Paenibacillus thalictri]TBL71222.1 hypothetical protein EYB31_31100 [Paenibacillus thalictri]
MTIDKDMNPFSGEEVETDGIYANEAGREELLRRGDTFPSDLTLGKTEWELVSLPLESQEAELYKDESSENKALRKHLDLGTRSPKTRT